MLNENKLVDTRQLLYFVTCVQTGSFSSAARALHSTQPNVSKVMKAMEDTVGVRLFDRSARGIVLTADGERIYRYACTILDSLKKIQPEELEKREQIQRLSMSVNPSSWFADTFLDFYLQNEEKKIVYQVYSAKTSEIVSRVKERIDEIGFVYVMKKDLLDFQTFLEKNYLQFVFLSETDVMAYPGKKHSFWTEREQEFHLEDIRLVQRFSDEFSADNYWEVQDRDGNAVSDLETAVTTNSDYIMERLLDKSSLVNISTSYLTQNEALGREGIPLTGNEEGSILFGYLQRREEDLSDCAEAYIAFLEKKLNC